jgi:tripartite-type tricarboxylate transporter receptor subunit TctC
MSGPTRRWLLGGLAGLAVGGARADTWPSRTITIVHGFPPGGPSDVVARILADGLSPALGQSVIVEARPGASGMNAAAQVARAVPDGYTLLVIPSGHASAAATFAHLSFRPIDDFATISLVSEYPYVMCVNAASGIDSVAALIEAAHARSTPLLYGTPGVGSGPHLGIELFALKTRIKVLHVPYHGSAPAVMELLGGRIDFIMDPPTSSIELIRTGRLRPLAVSSARRYFALPDVPPLAETGVPGFDVRAWQGLVAPAGLSESILNRLNGEVVRILKEPATIERMHAFGNESAPTSRAEFRQRLIDDVAKWTAFADEIHFERI